MQQPDAGVGHLEGAGDGMIDAPAMTATTPPHAALMRRLTERNSGCASNCRGTLSRAYCSVNGITGSSRKMMRARIAAAIPGRISPALGPAPAGPGEDREDEEHRGARHLDTFWATPRAPPSG